MQLLGTVIFRTAFPALLSLRRSSGAFLRSIVWTAVAVSMMGCAGTKYATESPSIGQASEVEGIRYYNDAPFVLVYSDGKGGLSSSLIWLPDTTKVRILRPYAWASKNNATYKFNNGVLTEAKSVVDETIVPAAVLTAAKDIVLARFPNADAAGAQPGTAIPPPALFRIVVDANGDVLLRGAYGKDKNEKELDVNVTVSKPAAKEGTQ
jgi:hypothetical protein